MVSRVKGEAMPVQDFWEKLTTTYDEAIIKKALQVLAKNKEWSGKMEKWADGENISPQDQKVWQEKIKSIQVVAPPNKLMYYEDFVMELIKIFNGKVVNTALRGLRADPKWVPLLEKWEQLTHAKEELKTSKERWEATKTRLSREDLPEAEKAEKKQEAALAKKITELEKSTDSFIHPDYQANIISYIHGLIMKGWGS